MIPQSLALLLCALASCTSNAADLSTNDREQLRRAMDQYMSTAKAADWDGWGALVAPDVFYSPPNLSPMTSRADVVTWSRAFPKITRLVLTADETVGRGDLAHVRGTYALDIALPDGSTAADSGVYLQVNRRQPDGSWLITHMVYHSVMPLPTPASTGK
jgi:ketosteroid isomerase-like protein